MIGYQFLNKQVGKHVNEVLRQYALVIGVRQDGDKYFERSLTIFRQPFLDLLGCFESVRSSQALYYVFVQIRVEFVRHQAFVVCVLYSKKQECKRFVASARLRVGGCRNDSQRDDRHQEDYGYSENGLLQHFNSLSYWIITIIDFSLSLRQCTAEPVESVRCRC